MEPCLTRTVVFKWEHAMLQKHRCYNGIELCSHNMIIILSSKINYHNREGLCDYSKRKWIFTSSFSHFWHLNFDCETLNGNPWECQLLTTRHSSWFGATVEVFVELEVMFKMGLHVNVAQPITNKWPNIYSNELQMSLDFILGLKI
jgi:hypothetical protein